MDEESKHATTSNLSRRLCDIMLACLPEQYAPIRTVRANWCRTDIKQRTAAVYSVRHSKKHVEVLLGYKETPGVRNEIENFLPAGVILKSRPYPHKSNWEKNR